MGVLGEYLMNMRTVDYLSIAFLAFMMIFVCVVAGKNGARKYVAVYLPLSLFFFVIAVCAEAFESRTHAFEIYLILECVFTTFSFLLFPTEVRRIFLSKAKDRSSDLNKGEKPKIEVEECISNIIKALQNMSKNDIGALIVLSNGNLPKQVLDSGITLNADISSQLLEGIFFPKAPLHDGAVILSGHKIRAAGCFLPLTQSLDYPKELGTRHRAGIGITEVANVTAIIVSEETGIISIVKQGRITRYADYEKLRATLEEYNWKDLSVEHKR